MNQPAAPLVSVVVAAYGRPAVLRRALDCVLAQTLQDWELLVVSDACAASSVVAAEYAARDPRVRPLALGLNWGEQSGPNNLGLANARGRWLALLNQDDLWWPDHLRGLLEWLQASGSDLAFAHAAHLDESSALERVSGRWPMSLSGHGRDGGYDPVTTFSPASAWLMTRRCLELTGPWRPARECVAESSQDFLFRAWRAGLRLTACPQLSVLIFSSGSRAGSYVGDADDEQAWFQQRMRSDAEGLRLRLLGLACAGAADPDPGSTGDTRHGPWMRRLLGLAARCGLHPRAWDMRRRQALAPGDYVRRLRLGRGLAAELPRQTLQSAHARSVRAHCTYAYGRPLDFSRTGNAIAHQLQGWYAGEDWGSWSSGTRAVLLMRLEATAVSDGCLRLRAHAFVRRGCRRQRLELRFNGQRAAFFSLDSGTPADLVAAVPRALLQQDAWLEIELLLPDAVRPKRRGSSGDTRCLALGLHHAVLDAATT